MPRQLPANCQFNQGICVAEHDDQTFEQTVADVSAAEAGHWLAYYEHQVAGYPDHPHWRILVRRCRTLAARIAASEWAA